MIDIIKVSNDSELREFVMFPFKLYKAQNVGFLLIIEQEMNSFNKELKIQILKMLKLNYMWYQKMMKLLEE